MNKIRCVICLIVSLTILSLIPLSAQGDFGYGFRAGLSFSQLKGELEMDNAGNSLDEYSAATGFHIGISLAYKFTDLMGVRGEFIFSQRGTQYAYNGESYYILGLHENESIVLNGTRDMTQTITNAYIDIPISVYYKLGSLELSGGVGAGLSVGSTGGGRILFNGNSPTSGRALDEFRVDLNYNFRTNGAKQVDNSFSDIMVDGRTFNIPNRVGAYYWFEEKGKDQFKSLDYYLMGGLSYYLNQGLYLGGRIFYGLTDVDRNEYDVSLRSLDADGNYIFREDDNKNITFQVSIGFTF